MRNSMVFSVQQSTSHACVQQYLIIRIQYILLVR